MPKYLMFDHGGVLDGEFVHNHDSITPDDFILTEHKEGGYQVLKNGVQIVNQLNDLVNQFGYEIVFHSKNVEANQVDLLKDLLRECKKRKLNFPPVVAMAVCDEKKYAGVESRNSLFEYNSKYHIQMSVYGVDLDGKSCVRIALSRLLMIDENERNNNYVFDDAKSVVAAAIDEGYQGVLVAQSAPLADSLQNIIVEVKKQASHGEPAFSSQRFYTPQQSTPIQDPQFITIQGLKAKIDEELSSIICVNRNAKMHKSRFLGKVIDRYISNPGVTMQECILSLKSQYPENYQEAISGKHSKRIKNAFDEIISPAPRYTS